MTDTLPAQPVTGPAGWQAVAGVADLIAKRRSRSGGRTYSTLRWAGAGLFAALLVALVVTIVAQSSQAFAHWGIAYLWTGTWNPAVLLLGTVITTLAAMVLVIPIGLAFATYLSEFAPRWIAAPISTAVDLLAAIPSIVVGLWALLVLSPVFARDVEPFMRSLPVLGHLFSGFAYGPSIFLASVVLAVMALPSIVTLSRTAIQGVELADREAAMAVGATRWQVTRFAVLPAARSGIAAAITLAIGRALGESIAVALIIGNRPGVPHSLLAPGATLGSAIVNQFAEATPGLGTSAVIGLGAVLLLLTVVVNLGGQALLHRKSGGGAGGPAGAVLPRGPAASTALSAEASPEPEADGASGRDLQKVVRQRSERTVTRRRIRSGIMQVLCGLAVVAGLVPLVALVYYTVVRGAKAVSISFLTHGPTPPGVPGGGISTAIIGSAKIAGIALLISVPIGMLTALFLYERKGRLASAIRFSAAVLTGVPSIILGIFAYGLLVRPMHQFSDLAAGFAIAVLMLPIMIRANEEALRTVALELWEAGMALGARRSSVARSVVIRGALPGLVSGNLLALARGLGETAPLLFTVAAPTLGITLLIFSDGTQPFGGAQQTAWGAAFVLMVAVLVLSIATRVTAWAFTRKTR